MDFYDRSNFSIYLIGIVVLLLQLQCVGGLKTNKESSHLPRRIITLKADMVNDESRELLIHNGFIPHIEISSSNSISGQISDGDLQKLQNLGLIESSEEDFKVKKYAQSTPWGIKKIAADTILNKASGIKICVIDTGVDLEHPDLNVVNGASFVKDVVSADDDEGHGTHVAGTIAAKDNDIGVVGVASQATVYAVKVLDNEGSGYVSWIAAGIDWCRQQKVDIINMSLGLEQSSKVLETAVSRAYTAGIVLVAAAGNEGSSTSYPAKYSQVISVSAVDSDLDFPDWSNYGSWVTIAAPGVSINSTKNGGSYEYLDGTSMASPHVAAACALIRKIYPEYTPLQIKNFLIQNAVTMNAPNTSGHSHHEKLLNVSNFNLPAMVADIRLNEIYPQPATGQSEYIEIVNLSNQTLDLAGWSLDDIAGGGSSPYLFPAGSMIAAGGYLLVSAKISLNNGGDEVRLINPAGTVIDSYTYASSAVQTAIGRIPDATGSWQNLPAVSPGAKNAQAVSVNSLMINEYLPRPATGKQEFIEIFNSSSSDIDVSGYTVDDIENGGSAPYTIPAGTIIKAASFLVLYAKIALNNDSDSVILKNSGGQILDSQSYSSPLVDTAYARKSNGSSEWISTENSTPGQSNSVSVNQTNSTSALVINEILPAPSATGAINQEFIEIYNHSETDLDIGGFLIDDILNGGSAPYIIPAGSIIKAKSFLVFQARVVLNNTNDTANLLDPSGKVLDSFSYTSTIYDTSYARNPVGTGSFNQSLPTPGK